MLRDKMILRGQVLSVKTITLMTGRSLILRWVYLQLL